MASVDWQKTNVPTLARKRGHFDNEKRASSNHSNEDIDKELTSNNYYLGCKDWGDILKKSREFIRDTDSKHPPKKKVSPDERITMVALNIPCPSIITEMGKSEEFFQYTNEILEDLFIGYMGMAVHVDEVHEYMDSRNKQIRTSLIHGHAWTCAYTEWEDKKGNKRQGINGKNFETRANILRLNNAMNEMCLERFGIPYNTGDEPRKKSVETLKQESYKSLQKEIPIQQRANINLTNANELLAKEYANLKRQNAEISQDNKAKQVTLAQTEQKLESANSSLDRVSHQQQQIVSRIQQIIETTDVDEITYQAALNVINNNNLQSELDEEIEKLKLNDYDLD